MGVDKGWFDACVEFQQWWTLDEIVSRPPSSEESALASFKLLQARGPISRVEPCEACWISLFKFLIHAQWIALFFLEDSKTHAEFCSSEGWLYESGQLKLESIASLSGCMLTNSSQSL